MATRQYSQREWRLLSWWLAMHHQDAEIALNLKVGPAVQYAGAYPGDPAAGESVRVRHRWVDALFIEAGELNLVEAKLEPDPGIFSQLIHYARKLRADPAWSTYSQARLNLIALVYHDDPSVAIEAPWYGVRWVVYQPNLVELPPANRGLPVVGFTENPLPQGFSQRLASWGITALAIS